MGGFISGLVAPRFRGAVAAVTGVIAGYPIALGLGLFPFLGDAWPVAMLLAIAATVAGLAVARLVQGLWRRLGTQ